MAGLPFTEWMLSGMIEVVSRCKLQCFLIISATRPTFNTYPYVIWNGCRLDTTVYRKPTDKGLLLHYHSHVAAGYKRSLLNIMLNRAFQLSSM